MKRRQFLRNAGLGLGALVSGCSGLFPEDPNIPVEPGPKDYLPLTIEFVDDAPLDESGLSGMSSAERAIYMCSPLQDTFDLGDGIKTGELWFAIDRNENVTGIFYRDIEQVPDLVHLKTAPYKVFQTRYKDKVLNWEMEYFGCVIEARFTEGKFTEPDDKLVTSFDVSNINGFRQVNSLGSIVSKAEPLEVSYFGPEGHELLGTKTTDKTLTCGTIVENPAENGAADRVKLWIPSY